MIYVSGRRRSRLQRGNQDFAMQQELEAAHDGLFLAAEHGRADVLKALLDHGKDVLKLDAIRNAEGLTPLHVAVVHQKTDAVRALLSAGFAADAAAIPSKKPSKYTHKTAYEIALGQLPHRAMVQVFGQYIVQHVAMNDVPKVEELLRAGIDGATATDGPPHENTLLHWAASSNAVDVLSLLLRKYGRSPVLNQQNADGATALHEACHVNSAECVQLLVDFGADLSLVGTRGYVKGKAPVEVASKKEITRIIAKGKITKRPANDVANTEKQDAEDRDVVMTALATSPRARAPTISVVVPTTPTFAASAPSTLPHDSHVRHQLEEKDALIAQLKESMEALVTDVNDRNLLGEHEAVLDYIRKLRAEKALVERRLYDAEEHIVVQEEQMMGLKAQIRSDKDTIETLRKRVTELEAGATPSRPLVVAEAPAFGPGSATLGRPPTSHRGPIVLRDPPPQPAIADVFDYASVRAKAMAEPESFWHALLQFLWPFGNTAADEPRPGDEVFMTV
ncbi:hypothetical protein SDRG_01322 [Saprolegnia diclina VS20]|uniref:Uncharacterized protein n=1 Tax=Saprolegnia diclina (strain VS20) TaxID=1156394 RepID=T0S816_SAPDV|nr:hypothetical protein SDRG_01322 [Saprolegnia diclina VS20]EQC41348.1 hypothetical protein SDRG_01322 [Saprolegnia diclina VS20]|eukprot:XP_008605062.1 hypothetical protein SDRG_01322 [Saprolegnia diclina VS20]